MSGNSRYILSIAGLDPSGGAGLLADIKVFEQFNLVGLGIATAITWQNDDKFEGVKWLAKHEILSQLKPLKKFPVEAVKIGLIENFEMMQWLLPEVRGLFPKAKIIWDPVLKASAGFSFHEQINFELLQQALNNVFCITPNLEEAKKLGALDAFSNARELSNHCYIWLKGGHHQKNADDVLFNKGQILAEYRQQKIEGLSKHGSGCVFSSALASSLANGKNIKEAGRQAKEYTLEFLESTNTLLGKHKDILVETPAMELKPEEKAK